MLQQSSRFDAGLDKLQAELLQMEPGDELSVERAVELSGLDEETCEFVLDALMRGGLMVKRGRGSYVRCRLRMPAG